MSAKSLTVKTLLKIKGPFPKNEKGPADTLKTVLRLRPHLSRGFHHGPDLAPGTHYRFFFSGPVAVASKGLSLHHS
jgi:hypothetical protein